MSQQLIKCPTSGCTHKARQSTLAKYGVCSNCNKRGLTGKILDTFDEKKEIIDLTLLIPDEKKEVNIRQIQDDFAENDPDIILPIKARTKFSAKFRLDLWKEHFGRYFDGTCFCGAHMEFPNFHIAHIIPFCQGGSDNISNLTITCMPCNLAIRDENLVSYYMELYNIDIRAVNRKCAENHSKTCMAEKTINQKNGNNQKNEINELKEQLANLTLLVLEISLKLSK